jgi:2-C-methyl-D-erythritol 2,4-cyclodiphosphate synthase
LAMYRSGTGYDVHKFEGSGPLRLGGIDVPHHTGLSGHSDADVLLHAICDALLGAAALPDIGSHFPPGDPFYKDISSRVLLARTCRLVADKGFTVCNVDSTIICEAPHLAELIPKMKEAIAETIGIGVDCVGVKATTSEGLGFVGRREGIAAMAVVMLKTEGF